MGTKDSEGRGTHKSKQERPADAASLTAKLAAVTPTSPSLTSEPARPTSTKNPASDPAAPPPLPGGGNQSASAGPAESALSSLLAASDDAEKDAMFAFELPSAPADAVSDTATGAEGGAPASTRLASEKPPTTFAPPALPSAASTPVPTAMAAPRPLDAPGAFGNAALAMPPPAPAASPAVPAAKPVAAPGRGDAPGKRDAKASQRPEAGPRPGPNLRAEPNQRFELRADPDRDPSPPAGSHPGRGDAGGRRAARRRPSGPARDRVAANDDAPSIGGLIYALEQKPSSEPFRFAAFASIGWALLGCAFAGFAFYDALADGKSIGALLLEPLSFAILAGIAVPIAVMWFLATLAWRAEELRLRSSTMTEVAIRLAEPDRMAEQSVVSLGQAVRRQVSFMNDAVTRALGRAGELEALVQHEVSSLERSYEENERKIRGLIEELSSERFQLLDTSERIAKTLEQMGTRVPELLESLTGQQQKLAGIIEGADENLSRLENSLSGRTNQLQSVLTDYTGALDIALEQRTDQLQNVLTDQTQVLDATLEKRTGAMQELITTHRATIDEAITGEHARLETVLSGQASRISETLETQNARMQAVLQDYTVALAAALGSRSDDMQFAFEQNMERLDQSIAERTDSLQAVFEAYAQALDTTIAQRADALDSKLVERTRALDHAFAERLRKFDESVTQSTLAIDSAVGERAQALANALESHSRTFKETIRAQAADLDESMALGINAVRRSSENITRHSLKAIEGIASQSDLLKNVSENLLAQINSVTNRFDAQGQSIMKAANALEAANFKIDKTLQNRHAELSNTLDRMSGKAEEFGRVLECYSTTIEGTLSEAELRARAVAEELTSGTMEKQRAVLENLERFRSTTDDESQRALAAMRERFAVVSDELSQHLSSLTNRIDETGADVRKRAEAVSSEMTDRLGTMSNRFQETSEDVRRRAEAAANTLDSEQERLRQQLESLPKTAEQSTEAMRRVLQDQLRALDELAKYTARESRARDVAAPVEPPQAARTAGAAQIAQGGAMGAPTPNPDARAAAPGSRSIDSLTDNLAREISQRKEAAQKPRTPPAADLHDLAHGSGHGGTGHGASGHGASGNASGGNGAPPTGRMPPAPAPSPNANAPAPGAPGAPGPARPGPRSQQPPRGSAPSQGREGWSLGDLLKRASDGQEGAASTAAGSVPGPAASAAPGAAPGAAAGGQPPDLQSLARALTPDMAMQVWDRLRAGERGFLSPAMYAPAAQAAFRDVSRRHAQDRALQEMVTRYLAGFESALREAEARDPSGAAVTHQLVSDSGRIYLVLAHASGRLN